MGTRGLLGFIINGQRYAAYCQYNCFPENMGVAVLTFLLNLNDEDWAKMLMNVKEIEWVQEDSKPSAAIQERYLHLDFYDGSVADQTTEDWYCLLRNIQGADTLPQILNGNLKHLVNKVEFLDDSLMCEWAYFINFEKKSLQTLKAGSCLDTLVLDGSKVTDAEIYMKLMRRKAEDGEIEEDEEDD